METRKFLEGRRPLFEGVQPAVEAALDEEYAELAVFSVDGRGECFRASEVGDASEVGKKSGVGDIVMPQFQRKGEWGLWVRERAGGLW